MTGSTIGPRPPIELTGDGERFGTAAPLPPDFVAAVAAACPTSTRPDELAEASRDWWPLAMHWSLAGQVPRRAALLARPTDTAQVARVTALCHQHRVPLTAAAGRSGVLGASVPVFGGVVLDTTALTGIVAVDEVSGLVTVRPGTFGPDLESELRSRHGLTVGHFPQSFDISTVGGWVACNGAGQYSTRYGTIASMVAGLEVVLADGSVVRTGGHPAAAQGSDLTSLFVGSEGTLGIITEVTLRAHPLPAAEQRGAWRFASLTDGIDACRRILRRGATPAVLRLYDEIETQRSHGGDGTWCALLVLDEGDPTIVTATMEVVGQECAAAVALDTALVEAWMQHRNETGALQALTRKGFVVDTLEVSAPWSALPRLVEAVGSALRAVPHARAASCHLSHSYLDGACIYFTFAATPPAEEVEATYVALWDAGQRAALTAGASLSHHHGVGLNRARFTHEALGAGFDVLRTVQRALDPNGILNPGKMGMPSPHGEVPWP